MFQTRSRTSIYLIGHPIDDFEVKSLPSIQDVLRNYFSYHEVKGSTQKDAIAEVTQNLKILWIKSGIPIFEDKNIIRKVAKEVKNYRNVLRNSKRKGQGQLDREADFSRSIRKLFDISCKNASNLMVNDASRSFLRDQQSARQLTLPNLMSVNYENTEHEQTLRGRKRENSR